MCGGCREIRLMMRMGEGRGRVYIIILGWQLEF
jgi:hypothetical protein